MGDLSPNLADGELYLPSDIFPEEIIYTYQNYPTNNTIFKNTALTTHPNFSSELTFMEDLAHRLATYASFLEPNLCKQAQPKPPPTATQCKPFGSLQSGFGLCRAYPATSAGSGFSDFWNGGFLRPSSRPGYRFYPVEPNPVQVESVMQVRSGAMQRQHQNPVQNRFLPVRPSSKGSGGFVKKSGGTGVFLPREFLIPEVSEKAMMRSAQQKQPERNVAAQGLAFQRASSDIMGLPQDWTY